MSRKIIALVLSFGLLFQQAGLCQGLAELNLANYLGSLHNSLAAEKFRPLHLRYFSYDTLSNDFRIFLDKGDFLKGLSPKGTDPEAQLKAESQELLKYFLIGITLPDDCFWVNLRPDSPDNIIDPYLYQTEMGRVFLEADLQLKKDTAKMTSPATPEGRIYWDKLYKKADELFGYENVTIPTLTRPWIVPGEIIIRQTKESGYIYKANLKVMLESDYLKGLSPKGAVPEAAAYDFKDPRMKVLNEYSSQLIREAIIPKLTKEVNTSQRYAALRQAYYSLILARWFKTQFKGKPGIYPALIDKKNLDDLISKTQWSKEDYFKQYQQSFRQGEYNIQEPTQTPYGQVIRSYFSGGLALQQIAPTGGFAGAANMAPVVQAAGMVPGVGNAATGLKGSMPELGGPANPSTPPDGYGGLNPTPAPAGAEELKTLARGSGELILDDNQMASLVLAIVRNAIHIHPAPWQHESIKIFDTIGRILVRLSPEQRQIFLQQSRKLSQESNAEMAFYAFLKSGLAKQLDYELRLRGLRYDSELSESTQGATLQISGIPAELRWAVNDLTVEIGAAPVRGEGVSLLKLTLHRLNPGATWKEIRDWRIQVEINMEGEALVSLVPAQLANDIIGALDISAPAAAGRQSGRVSAERLGDPFGGKLGFDNIWRQILDQALEAQRLLREESKPKEALGLFQQVRSRYEAMRVSHETGTELRGMLEDNLHIIALMIEECETAALAQELLAKLGEAERPQDSIPTLLGFDPLLITSRAQLKTLLQRRMADIGQRMAEIEAANERAQAAWNNAWVLQKDSYNEMLHPQPLYSDEEMGQREQERDTAEARLNEFTAVYSTALRGVIAAFLSEQLGIIEPLDAGALSVLDAPAPAAAGKDGQKGPPATGYSAGGAEGRYEPPEVAAAKASAPVNAGGIDFRSMNIITQPMGSFVGLDFRLPLVKNAERIDLDKEFAQIRLMVERGISPSGQRIKEFIAACWQRHELDRRLQDVMACLVDVCRLEEENLSETSPQLRECLVIVDSGKIELKKS